MGRQRENDHPRSCDLLAVLGYADADDRKTKLRLAHAINGARAADPGRHGGGARRQQAEGGGAGELQAGRLLRRAVDEVTDRAGPRR